MTAETATGYWTLSHLTFCDEHALEATNGVFHTLGMEPAETMSEAANVVEMLRVLAHDAQGEALINYSEEGPCDQCLWLAEREAVRGGDAA